MNIYSFLKNNGCMKGIGIPRLLRIIGFASSILATSTILKGNFGYVTGIGIPRLLKIIGFVSSILTVSTNLTTKINE
jgi:hypothetical protein